MADTFFKSGMKFLTQKNLYIADNAEKKVKGMQFLFGKFPYFRHFDILYSNYFSTVSKLFLNESFAWLLQEQQNDIEQEFAVHSHLHHLLF